MSWLINGRSFEMEAIAEDEKVPLDTLELWQIVNDSPIAHPMHFHNIQFNVDRAHDGPRDRAITRPCATGSWTRAGRTPCW